MNLQTAINHLDDLIPEGAWDKNSHEAWKIVKTTLMSQIKGTPLSCEGCELVGSVHCKSCIRNATTDWFTSGKESS